MLRIQQHRMPLSTHAPVRLYSTVPYLLSMLCTLCKVLSRRNFEVFFFPSTLPPPPPPPPPTQKTGSDISCKLSPMKIICMKYHILFSGKEKYHQVVVWWISLESSKCQTYRPRQPVLTQIRCCRVLVLNRVYTFCLSDASLPLLVLKLQLVYFNVFWCV